jgi:succinoglycan biosynthesis protein ExoW
MIGVVIPFYQKSPGLLRRALESVGAQKNAPDWRAYIVDDGSPVPATDEIRHLPAFLAARVHILRQKNAGAGAARNHALDALAADVSVVAFLDSDDAWNAFHLSNADAAIAAGADFYFSNHKREEDAETRFSQCGYGAGGPMINKDGQPIFWCDTKALFRAAVLRSPIGTSTVALRRRSIGRIRFRNAFRSAGEDSIFWLELLSSGVRAACSPDCEAVYGRGVSIFNHRSWGDIRSLRTTLDQMRSQLYIRNNFRLDPDMIAACNARCRDLDLAFCRALLACVRRFQWSAHRPAAAYIGARPRMLLQVPRATAKAMRQHTSWKSYDRPG